MAENGGDRVQPELSQRAASYRLSLATASRTDERLGCQGLAPIHRRVIVAAALGRMLTCLWGRAVLVLRCQTQLCLFVGCSATRPIKCYKYPSISDWRMCRRRTETPAASLPCQNLLNTSNTLPERPGQRGPYAKRRGSVPPLLGFGLTAWGGDGSVERVWVQLLTARERYSQIASRNHPAP